MIYTLFIYIYIIKGIFILGYLDHFHNFIDRKCHTHGQNILSILAQIYNNYLQFCLKVVYSLGLKCTISPLFNVQVTKTYNLVRKYVQ